jgi:hypothetical protein
LNEHWCELVPILVETSYEGKATIVWNQQVQTDRTIPNNKADVRIRDHENGTCMLLDVTLLGGINVIKKEAEKIIKYKDLVVGREYMWNVKESDTGNNRGSWYHQNHSEKYLSKIPRNHEM